MRVAVGVALLLLLSGCSARREADRWLEAVQQANQLADEALRRGHRTAARQVLAASLERSVPQAIEPDDARRLRQDLFFRLALIELQDGTAMRALEVAERGLALGQEKDLFTANLLLARGRALEALGRDREAAAAYQQALQINETLLRLSLERSGERP